MGNSIYGQTPSIIFTIIRENVLNESTNSYEFKTDKYDFQKELILLSTKEKSYFNNIINYHNSLKTNEITHEQYKKNIICSLDNLNNSLIKIELIKDMLQKK